MSLRYHSLFRLAAPEFSSNVSNILEAQYSDGLFRHHLSRMIQPLESYARPLIDLYRQSANLAGYGNLPKGFMCGFVGGWLFATPSFLSTFYACAIALNTQLVFVHNRIPDNSRQVLYLVIPPILALLICTSIRCNSEYPD